MKVNVEKLAYEIEKELMGYHSQTVQSVENVVLETAKEIVKELNQTSPVGSTGDYAKSWAHKKDPNIRGMYRFSRVVYSKKPSYRLTHLLERGHAKVNGGRVPGKPHIQKAEKLAEKLLRQKLAEELEG